MKEEDFARMARQGENLERFAALVAEAEREACARLCDEIAANYNNPTASECATAIRSRT